MSKTIAQMGENTVLTPSKLNEIIDGINGLNSDVTWTVGASGADYTSLQTALEDAAYIKTRNGKLTINLESDYSWDEQIDLSDKDYENVEVTKSTNPDIDVSAFVANGAGYKNLFKFTRVRGLHINFTGDVQVINNTPNTDLATYIYMDASDIRLSDVIVRDFSNMIYMTNGSKNIGTDCPQSASTTAVYRYVFEVYNGSELNINNPSLLQQSGATISGIAVIEKNSKVSITGSGTFVASDGDGTVNVNENSQLTIDGLINLTDLTFNSFKCSSISIDSSSGLTSGCSYLFCQNLANIYANIPLSGVGASITLGGRVVEDGTLHT